MYGKYTYLYMQMPIFLEHALCTEYQLQLIECVDMSAQAFASASITWKHKVDSELLRDVAADVRGQRMRGEP